MMVESTERPHRSKTSSSGATSELFICFSTSRLSSSSSMKLSSKSLLSPGRTRDQTPQISLSSSLSRRLRTSGSIKGGASPMFPSGGGSKKRGGYENPEPSSPKVTCIGQVRVKTKKQGKKMRMISSRSKRSRSGGGGVGGAEASFRKAEQSVNQHETFQALHFPTHPMSSSSQRECLRQRNNNNQRWVHLPLTICEALRAFGSEFNCLIPNKSSCLSGGEAKKEEESKGGARSESGCGAVFARWFVALGDGEDGNKRREIELVVGEEEEEERTEMSSGSHSLRRQVFEGIEFKEEILSEALMREEEEGRVSICVPPKNALLLMRCRSDPVKMAALGNRFWEMPAAPKEEEESEDEEQDEGLEEKRKRLEEKEKMQIGLPTEIKLVEDEGMCEKWVCEGEDVEEPEEKEEELNAVVDDEKPEKSEIVYEQLEVAEEKECQEQDSDREEDKNEAAMVEEAGQDCSLAELFADPEMSEVEEIELQLEEANQEMKEEEMRVVQLPISEVVLEKLVEEEEAESWAETETETEVTEESTESTAEEGKESRESTWEDEAEETQVTVTQARPEPEFERPKAQTDLQPKRSSQNPVLPDCLLLMMCEPKLSMEVSKETWVCSTDFIRCLPERHVSSNKKDGKDEAKKPPRVSVDSKAAKPAAAAAQQVMIQPPRSSCSFPIQAGGPVSMAEIIGQKLVGSTGYEPFVLTRCKSEPMRSASKLAPEACFWKNRKLEPHRHPGPLGVGATGVGF
ncbi:PREDICTED: uncharacterized protein LOC101292096 [Fragaria vesca subsp. vesca]|uniref:uncharacterized protein LOC101292096 n=1 Tax=Fragaria vesca subsp. vesca TaxID=101020 RepID=UPI0002C36CCE|nr:PREDICTED: uncharacterized protein LOC101292096 [Fragaria vesca subsp. vesca]